MFLQISVIFLIIAFLSGIFAVCGEWLYCKAVSEGCSHPVSFRMGTGFFLGMAFFIALWKIMAFVSGNANLTLAATIVFMIVVALINIKSHLPAIISYFGSINMKRIGKIVLAVSLIALVYVIETLYNVDPFGAGQLTIKGNLGSLHSGRYANVATFITEANQIPVLNQNYGQSLLAAVPLILGFNSPYLALNLWLSTSIIFMCLGFYGFFIMLGLNNSMSLIGSILLMIGNTALSFFAILVVDSGSPLFLSGYTDAVFSVGSFLGFLILLKNFYDDKIKSALYFSVAAAILCVSWNLSALQNIIMAGVLVTIISGIMLIKKRLSGKHMLLYALMVLFVLAGISQGGFLTPRKMCDNVEIPGVMGAAYNDRRGKSSHAMFEFPYFHLYKGKWVYGMFYEKREIYQALEDYKSSPGMQAEYSIYDMYYELWYEIETDFFNSLRITFFPLLGLILPWFISGFRKGAPDDEFSDMKKLWFVSLIVFLLGYLIAFLGEFHGFKWELSRFLIPGYAIAAISFVASFNMLLKNASRRKSRIFICIIIFIMIFGQVSLLVNQINKNVFDSGNANILPFSERFDMLVNLRGMQSVPDYMFTK